MLNGYLIVVGLGMIVDDPSPFLRWLWGLFAQLSIIW